MPKTYDKTLGLNQTDYAKHRLELGLKGSTPTAITLALKHGRIHKNEHGLIDPVQADAEWIRNTSTDKYTQAERANTGTCGTDADDLPAVGVSEARIKAIKAIKEDLSLQELQGQLVKVDDIHTEMFSIVNTLKQAMLQIPSKVAPALCSLSDITDIENLLDDEINASLMQMYKMFGKSKHLSGK